jgi:hypothetical protein
MSSNKNKQKAASVRNKTAQEAGTESSSQQRLSWLNLRSNWIKLGAIGIAVLIALIFFLVNSAPNSNKSPTNAVGAPSLPNSLLQIGANGSTPPALPVTPQMSYQQRLAALKDNLQLVDHTLCSYKESTKYPPNSRPISEHPDQIYPNQPVAEQHPLRKEGGGTDGNIQVSTTQSRVFLAAGESVSFTVKANDQSGKSLPVNVTRATARGITYQGSRESPQLPLAMADDGQNGDAIANDGVTSGVLSPAQTGFASFNGTIRTEVRYSVGGQAGIVVFDVIYSPETPAVWTGKVRDAVENGALNFYLKVNVKTPGRYIVNGRVDDSKGKPFALVNFNDLLPQGENEIRLTVAGKLLRDNAPAFPLTLRDVDAYLLKEDVDPDRALLPRLEGTAAVSKSYNLQNFSEAEWQSEERSRYLAEYAKDVALAKAALVELNPEQARLPFPVSECSDKQAALITKP